MRRALASDSPPTYQRPAQGSVVDAVEPQIRELLHRTPTMPATVIAERIGWERGLTVLKDRVRELRPYYPPPDPATRTGATRAIGCRATCGSRPRRSRPVPGEGSPPVLVMTSGYSRMRWAVMIPSRTAPDLIAGHWQLLAAMGVARRQLVWDNEGAVGGWRRGKPTLSEEFESIRGSLGANRAASEAANRSTVTTDCM